MKKTLWLIILYSIVALLNAQGNDYNYYKSLGTVEYYEKNYLQSIFNFQKAFTLKPSDKEISAFLKMCYDSIGGKDLVDIMRLKTESFSANPADNRPAVSPASLSEQQQNPLSSRHRILQRPLSSGFSAARDLRQLADYFLDRESFDSAALCYQHYLSLYPKDTSIRYYYGVCLYHAAKYEEAVFNFQLVLLKDANRAELYNWIGVCELLRTNYLAARDNFKQCIKLDPDYAPAYFNLGKTQYELEDFGDAQKNLEKAQELMPGDADLLRMLADIYYNTQNWEKAKALYEQLYPKNRKNEKVNFRLGDIFLRDGQWDMAITYFGNYLQMVPSAAEANKKIGIAYYNIDKYLNALQSFDKAAKILWDDKELLLYGAISANKTADYVKAQDYAERAINLDKNYIRAYFQLAAAFKGQGKKKESKEALARAKDLELNAVNLEHEMR